MGRIQRKINYIFATGLLFATFLLRGGFALAAPNYTWTIATSPGGQCQVMAMSANGKYMNCAMFNGPPLISTNYGANWSFVGSGIDTRQGVAVSATGQYILASSDFGITNVSNDYGATWNNFNQIAQDTMDAMSASGKYMMMTNDSGGSAALLSSNFGVSWNPVGGGLPLGSTHAIAMSASGQKIIVGTTSGGGNLYISNNYGTSWSSVAAPGSNSPSSISMSSDGSKVYLAENDSNVYFSNNGGNSWTAQAVSGASQLNQVATSADGERAAVSDTFFSPFNITLNHGQTWTPITGAGTPVSGQGGLAISSDMSYIAVVTPAQTVIGHDAALVAPVATTASNSPVAPNTGYGTPKSSQNALSNYLIAIGFFGLVESLYIYKKHFR